MTHEYRTLLAACRQCTLVELHRLLMVDLRRIQREKAQEVKREDWDTEEEKS